jgi:mercuric reductase
MKMSGQRTVAVLGGGSAGFTAARAAARHGARVVLFLGDNPDMASLCVNRGCMPSKAMFARIDALHHARATGLARCEPGAAGSLLGTIVEWKDREIARFRAYRQRAIRAHESDRFRVVRAAARFVDSHSLESGGERFGFDAAVIATGSRARIPRVQGIAELGQKIWTSEELLSNTKLPQSLVVVGAGAIGLEFALRYARLGCRVTIVARSRPLSHYPEHFGLRLARIYELEGVRTMLATAVTRAYLDAEGTAVVETDGRDGAEPLAADAVLLAAGRVPQLETLDLARAGVELDSSGGLDAGEDMRVAGHSHLFAAGDVLGRRMVVHQAHIEAGIAGENAATEGRVEWNRRADLQVVYSDPEFAWAGTTPAGAARSGLELVSASKESRLVGKLHLEGDDHGFGEFAADATTHRLVSAGLLCQGASDLIHLPGYVIDHGHTVHQAAGAEFYHPTRAEIVSSILDELCRALDGQPFRRADE